MDYFFHYTSFDSCLKIILSNELLLGKLQDMNDINELYRPLLFDPNDNQDQRDIFTNFIRNCQQLSLTHNGKRMGFDIPAMWGHYADKGNGVCLAFNKTKLLNRLNDSIIYNSKVSYINNFTSWINLPQKNKRGIPFSKRQLKQIFFKKTKDWSYEQEYRILAYDEYSENRIKLNYSDSLEYIIMHNAPDINPSMAIFCSNNFKMLKSIFCEDKILEYGTFINERNLRDYQGNSIWSSIDRKGLILDI